MPPTYKSQRELIYAFGDGAREGRASNMSIHGARLTGYNGLLAARVEHLGKPKFLMSSRRSPTHHHAAQKANVLRYLRGELVNLELTRLGMFNHVSNSAQPIRIVWHEKERVQVPWTHKAGTYTTTGDFLVYECDGVYYEAHLEQLPRPLTHLEVAVLQAVGGHV